MGTSTARQAPGGKYWRIAKTAMARFASGKEATPPQVKEIVARYLTALQADAGKGSGDTAFLPTLVQTAVSLGKFYQHWRQDGWEAALASLEVNPANRPGAYASPPGQDSWTWGYPGRGCHTGRLT